MGVLERRAREKEVLRAKILDAATSLFVEEGYENVSIRRIAEKIEYSPATIYIYFKDKAELIQAICEEAFGEMLETIGEAGRSAKDPIEGLRAGLRAYIDFGVTHPSHYLIVFGSSGSVPADAATCEQPSDLAMQTFDLLRNAIRSCVDAGAIPTSDVETASQTTWMAIHGITSLAINANSGACAGFPWMRTVHLIDSALDLVVSGLRNCTLRPDLR
jgi:AcrR family transcriptional regulator